ncbi:MAG: hypothetical protein JO319_08820 [Acidobacteriaceae bacterium]|nr:hypothetical protein [Acidobacteriaceae bacterium]
MPVNVPTKPVEDTVPKVNDEVAVGSDLEFQYRWWKFERIVWTFFLLIVIADVLGVFGRGPLAKAHARSKDGTIDLQYERVERFSTPSIMTVKFGPNAIRDGKIQLWVSQSVIKQLGNQRVVPQPLISTVGQDGILYTFPAASAPASASFALEPSSPGVFDFALQVPGAERLSARVYVMP